MTLETDLIARSSGVCEICGASDGLSVQDLGPKNDGSADMAVLTCATCQAGVGDQFDTHWNCLSDAIWSQTQPAQVLAYRLLHALPTQVWARDLLDIAYLEPEALAWAQAELPEAESDVIHKDTNGARLVAGDTVTLIKDLNVKGAGFTAKRGTAVRNISLVADNAGHIEGRVSGQQIVILTEFVKKSG